VKRAFDPFKNDEPSESTGLGWIRLFFSEIFPPSPEKFLFTYIVSNVCAESFNPIREGLRQLELAMGTTKKFQPRFSLP